MTRRARLLVSSIVASVLVVSTATRAHVMDAADPPSTATAPASAPTTTPGSLTVTVTAVEGLVQVRASATDQWQPAKVGMELGEQAEFRTGPRSAVQFKVPPDQTITVDRVTAVKVLQAVQQGGKIKTNIGMKYGRTRYSIEAAGVEHEATISSPSSTLAVRGTKFISYDQRPFPAQAVSLTGRVEVLDAKKRVFIGGRGTGKARVDENSSSAAEFAAAQTVVDPGQRLARTASEQPLIAALLSHGATISFDEEKGIRVVHGGRPLTDKELIPVLPGTLNFVLRWTKDADLNLGVSAPSQESQKISNVLYPLGGLNHLNSGATMPFDHTGGPNGGIEFCFWPGKFPDGVYRVAAQHISGEVTPATLDVFRVTSRGVERVPIAFRGQVVTTASTLVGPARADLNIEATNLGAIEIENGAPVTPGTGTASIRPTQVAKSLIGPISRIAGPPAPVTSAATTIRKSGKR